MSQTCTNFSALEQISVMAKTLRTAAATNNTELLHILVLALTPRMIELADLLTFVALEDADSVENLRTAVFGPVSEGCAAEASFSHE